MKKFREKMSERAGFTLVELIVVIAILGILTGAAVAGYSGYIKKAQDAADTEMLSAIKTAAVAAVAKDGTPVEIKVTLSDSDTSLKSVTVKLTSGGTDVTLYPAASSKTDAQADFAQYFTETSVKFSGTGADKNAVNTFNGTKWSGFAAPDNTANS